MVDLEEKQKYWREQLPKFEAKYWLPGHFSFLNFDMEQGNYVVKEGLDSIYEDDAIEIYHRVNTGWAMWKKCTSSMKAEINELKAKLEVAQVPEGFVLVPKEKLSVFWQDDDEPENIVSDESDFNSLGDCIDLGDVMTIKKHTQANIETETLYGTWFAEVINPSEKANFFVGTHEECLDIVKKNKAMIEAAQGEEE